MRKNGKPVPAEWLEHEKLLERLVHPAPLIHTLSYWLDVENAHPAMFSARLDPLCDNRHQREVSGLELTVSLRLLHEVSRLNTMMLAPFLLEVSESWAEQALLPEILSRVIDFKALPHPLILHVSLAEARNCNEALINNLAELKKRGCRVVLNGHDILPLRQGLFKLCDGVRFHLADLSASHTLQKRLLAWRKAGKFIQITGVAPQQKALAQLLGGDHYQRDR